MTTKVTFLCHGPEVIKITPVYPNGSEDSPVYIGAGQFFDQKYVYAGLSFKVEEVVRS